MTRLNTIKCQGLAPERPEIVLEYVYANYNIEISITIHIYIINIVTAAVPICHIIMKRDIHVILLQSKWRKSHIMIKRDIHITCIPLHYDCQSGECRNREQF